MIVHDCLHLNVLSFLIISTIIHIFHHMKHLYFERYYLDSIQLFQFK